MSRWFYYLHENGDMIGKNPVVVDSDPEYFDSPFVKKVWEIDTEKRDTLYIMVFQALTLGANKEKIREIANKQGMDLEDTRHMMHHVEPTEELVEGLKKFVPSVLGISMEVFLHGTISDYLLEKD